MRRVATMRAMSPVRIGTIDGPNGQIWSTLMRFVRVQRSNRRSRKSWRLHHRRWKALLLYWWRWMSSHFRLWLPKCHRKVTSLGAKNQRVSRRGGHFGHRFGSHWCYCSHRIIPDPHVENIHNYSRSQGVCQVRKGAYVGQVGYRRKSHFQAGHIHLQEPHLCRAMNQIKWAVNTKNPNRMKMKKTQLTKAL